MPTATGRLKTYLWAFNAFIGSRFSHSARVFSTYKIPLFGEAIILKSCRDCMDIQL